jgi:hypothetical protein
MSQYLTIQTAKRAIDVARPSIERVLNDRGLAKRYAGHLRVSSKLDGIWSLLATHDFGKRSEWEHPYEDHAASKERISQRTGLSSREAHALYPELIIPTDTVYDGSTISPGKTIVVAYSGVESYFDELFTKWVLAGCLALIDHKLATLKSTGTEYYA